MKFGKGGKRIKSGEKDEKEGEIVPQEHGLGAEIDMPGTTNFPIEFSPINEFSLKSINPDDIKEGDMINLVKADSKGLTIIDKKYTVKRLPDGKLEMTPSSDPQGPEDLRRAIATAIVVKHKEQIMQESVAAVEEALKRKPLDQLQKMREASDEGAEPTIRSRRGCMYFTLGDETVIL